MNDRISITREFVYNCVDDYERDFYDIDVGEIDEPRVSLILARYTSDSGTSEQAEHLAESTKLINTLRDNLFFNYCLMKCIAGVLPTSTLDRNAYAVCLAENLNHMHGRFAHSANHKFYVFYKLLQGEVRTNFGAASQDFREEDEWSQLEETPQTILYTAINNLMQSGIEYLKFADEAANLQYRDTQAINANRLLVEATANDLLNIYTTELFVSLCSELWQCRNEQLFLVNTRINNVVLKKTFNLLKHCDGKNEAWMCTNRKFVNTNTFDMILGLITFFLHPDRRPDLEIHIEILIVEATVICVKWLPRYDLKTCEKACNRFLKTIFRFVEDSLIEQIRRTVLFNTHVVEQMLKANYTLYVDDETSTIQDRLHVTPQYQKYHGPKLSVFRAYYRQLLQLFTYYSRGHVVRRVTESMERNYHIHSLLYTNTTKANVDEIFKASNKELEKYLTKRRYFSLPTKTRFQLNRKFQEWRCSFFEQVTSQENIDLADVKQIVEDNVLLTKLFSSNEFLTCDPDFKLLTNFPKINNINPIEIQASLILLSKCLRGVSLYSKTKIFDHLVANNSSKLFDQLLGDSSLIGNEVLYSNLFQVVQQMTRLQTTDVPSYLVASCLTKCASMFEKSMISVCAMNCCLSLVSMDEKFVVKHTASLVSLLGKFLELGTQKQKSLLRISQILVHRVKFSLNKMKNAQQLQLAFLELHERHYLFLSDIINKERERSEDEQPCPFSFEQALKEDELCLSKQI